MVWIEGEMASEQPYKKMRRHPVNDDADADDEPSSNPIVDEVDFIQTPHTETLPIAYSCEDSVVHLNNTVNARLNQQSIIINNLPIATNLIQSYYTNHNRTLDEDEIDILQTHLIKQCLCHISDAILERNYQITHTIMSEWTIKKILKFLSNLQLLFDVYLKQNNNGKICLKIVHICNVIIHNETNLIEQLITLNDLRNSYISYMTAKVIASFLMIIKTDVNHEWLENIIGFLIIDHFDYYKMNFALEIIKRVVEWKDIEMHVLDDDNNDDASTSTNRSDIDQNNCVSITYRDSESFDTSTIKGLIIRILETKWSELIQKIQSLIINQNNTIQSQTYVLTFFRLWESIISVKANLSIIDTKPFYEHLEQFVCLLNATLSPIIWKQMLSLFNEVLCYGNTLALQDSLPEDTCQLAHLIVRYVKDNHLLDNLPFRRDEGLMVHPFVGTINGGVGHSNIDRTLLQKMVLLVLKSIAITIKETRSDSSDSSIDSDYDFIRDMQVIVRSIRDVLRKLDNFVKNCLDFHPETPFSRILVRLLSDQDDYMIEAMICTLDVTIGVRYQNNLDTEFFSMLNPIHSFIEFLNVVRHDSDVLLDYLVSNETCFLLYLLRFLKYTKKNWDCFVAGCNENGGVSVVGGVVGTRSGNELDNTMTVLIRLNHQISRLVSRRLFPYNIDPVLKYLQICEGLYEGNEYS